MSRGNGDDQLEFVELIQRNAKCAECSEILKNHRMLQCQHTFCLECLEPLVTKESLKCPTCGKTPPLKGRVEYLPNSRLLTDALSLICSNCFRRKKELKCSHCKKWLCSECHATCREMIERDAIREDLATRSARFASMYSRYVANVREEQKAGRTQKDAVCAKIKNHADSLLKRIRDAERKLMAEVEHSEAELDDLIEEAGRLKDHERKCSRQFRSVANEQKSHKNFDKLREEWMEILNNKFWGAPIPRAKDIKFIPSEVAIMESEAVVGTLSIQTRRSVDSSWRRGTEELDSEESDSETVVRKQSTQTRQSVHNSREVRAGVLDTKEDESDIKLSTQKRRARESRRRRSGVPDSEDSESEGVPGKLCTQKRQSEHSSWGGSSRVLDVEENERGTKWDQATHRLWHVKQDEQIRDLCFVVIDGTQALLYITGSGDTRLISLKGKPLSLPIKKTGVKEPLCTASNTDGRQIVVAGNEEWRKGPYRWTVCSSQPGRLHQLQTFALDSPMPSVSWTPDGDIIAILGSFPHYSLARLSASGDMKWRHDARDIDITNPGRITVSPDTGNILICDYGGGCVRELSPQGQYCRDIPTPGVPRPETLSTDSRGRTLFVCDLMSRDIYLMSARSTQPSLLLRAPGVVESLRLHADRYLAVGTGKGLALYDVAAIL